MIVGAATFLPGGAALYNRRICTGQAASARYCYAVWLRHLTKLVDNGCEIPVKVAELGPGHSIGMGLAALLSGAEVYYGLDIAPFASVSSNIPIFDELVEMFRRREPIPDHLEFPGIFPELSSYEFPNFLEGRLQDLLAPDRLAEIRDAIWHQRGCVQYVAPWTDVINRDSIDLIFSQAVLEHVDDLPGAYRAMHAWLKPAGAISHQIDFRSHGTTPEWNGHWCVPDWQWTIMRGKRAYYLNRASHSVHLRLLQESGFAVFCDLAVPGRPIERGRLAKRFRDLPNSDLTISGAFIQARKI